MRANGVADLACGRKVAAASAVRTAEHLPSYFNTVSEDATSAVLADRREPVRGTFQRVENVPLTADRMDFETHPVVVTANLADPHDNHRLSVGSVTSFRRGSVNWAGKGEQLPVDRAAALSSCSSAGA
jgi:hypothetical protein